MSGPKCSKVRLLEREKRRLEVERQKRLAEELRKVKEGRHIQEEEKCRELDLKITAARTRLEEIKAGINEKSLDIISRAKSLYKKSHDLENLENLRDSFLRKIDAFEKSYGLRNISNMTSYLESLYGLINEIADRDMNEYQAGLKKVEQEIQHHRISAGEQNFFNSTFQKKQKKNISMEPVYKKGDTIDNSAINKELADFYAMVNPYLRNPFFRKSGEIDELIKAVDSIAKNDTFDYRYKSSQVALRKKIFGSMKTEYDREIKKNKNLLAEFEKVLDNYNALCSIAGEKAEPYFFRPETSIENIGKLNGEIERLQKLIEEKTQTDYITRSVDEVMKDLGYDVIATDHVTTPQKKSIHHIYEFEQGNVINVYTSDNGSLLFEVSAVKENDDPMTDLEKLKVKESMESFCTKYPGIKGRLRERGIQMDNEDLKPPDIRYARAINLHKKKITSYGKREDTATRPKEKKKVSMKRDGQ